MNREVALRVPPHAIEAEQSVLGAMMLSADARIAACSILKEQDFYRRDHQALFRAITWLDEKKRPCDPVTIGDWVERHNLTETVGDFGYIVELSQTVPSPRACQAYAEIVLEKAQLRRAIDVGQQIVNTAFEPDGRTALDVMGMAQTLVGNLMSDQPCEVESIGVPLAAAFEEIVDFHDRDSGGMDGAPTGYADLDGILGGMVSGVYLLAGRPKMGKSTLAQNIAEYTAIERKRPVLIFTLEMTPKQYAKRMISSVGDVDASRVRSGTLSDEEWSRVSEAQRIIRNSPIYIAKPGRARPELICAQARKQHAKTPLGCIVIDYIQLVELVPEYKGETMSSMLGRASRSFVQLAQELNVPVIVLSQLNRKLEERANKRPIPSDLRDSGALEQDAEAVIFIYREEVYEAGTPWKGTAEIMVSMNRHGPPGECRLLSRLDRYRLENLPFGWEPPERPKSPRKTKGAFGMRDRDE